MNPEFPPRPTQIAWMLLREVIREGDLVIDATAGNGHDTAFLAECVGPDGRVLAFDVQAGAITSASARIDSLGLSPRVEFRQVSHARMEEFAGDGSASAVMFNLGYLPGEDHALTTTASETLTALEAATRILAPGGALTLLCYPGHPAGDEEARAVDAWLPSLTLRGWRIARYTIEGTKRPAPFLVAGRKP